MTTDIMAFEPLNDTRARVTSTRDGKVTIVELHTATGKRVMGLARVAPGDKPDQDIGVRLAYSRALTAAGTLLEEEAIRDNARAEARRRVRNTPMPDVSDHFDGVTRFPGVRVTADMLTQGGLTSHRRRGLVARLFRR